MGLTQEIGEFVSGARFAGLPPDCIGTVCLGFTDCVAVMVAGWGETVSQIAARHFGNAPAHGSNRPLHGVRAEAPERALIYAVAAHALDYDDTALHGHPSAILVSAMFGALAAAAASASLRRLKPAQASQAVAVAASLAGGIVANFGSMTKPLQVGRAAQSGLMATRLVAAGMTASPDAIEDDIGFLRAISPHGAVDTSSEAKLGQEWAILRHGLNVKLYPVCYAAHRALDAVIELREQHRFRPDAIDAVTLEIGETQSRILRIHRPQNAFEAKICGEFAATAAVIAGRCGRAELTDEFVRRADVQGFLPKVAIVPVDGKDPDEPALAPFDRVRLRLRDGREIVSDPVFQAR